MKFSKNLILSWNEAELEPPAPGNLFDPLDMVKGTRLYRQQDEFNWLPSTKGQYVSHEDHMLLMVSRNALAAPIVDISPFRPSRDETDLRNQGSYVLNGVKVCVLWLVFLFVACFFVFMFSLCFICL